ncbi:ATPase SWSAP1 [Anguilla rostrata]|uniref:ATPase SWSAP1 n=1 Tax=Anguilla rostrata TaxID=7938 RepID=UPI0030CC125E
MYPKSQVELLQDVASLHESACGSAAPPSLLIVDGLERYLGAGPGAGAGPGGSPQGDSWLAAAHISALLVDTAAFLGRKLEERGGAGASCRVLVSFDTERQGHAPSELPAQDPVLSVLDRYFPVRATLDRDRSAAAPPGTAGEPGAVWQVYFSGVGVTAGHAPGKGKGPNLGLQWRLAICQNGAMEFSLVSGENQVKQ